MTLYVGDIHLKFKTLYQKLLDNDIRDCNIISLGDNGIMADTIIGITDWYKVHHEFLDIVNENMIELNNKLYLMRGNHDNPNWYISEWIKSNIYMVSDWETINIDNKNHLFIGGGVSIDRRYRALNYSYFNGEEVTISRKLNKIRNIDVVCTHTAPRVALPVLNHNILANWAAIDDKLYEDIDKESKTMKKIYDVLSTNNTIKEWYYGHFHIDYNIKYNEINFIGLDELSFYAV